MRDELTNKNRVNWCRSRTKELEELGYKTVIAPRDINLFYLDDQIRERIERKEDGTLSGTSYETDLFGK